MRAVPSREPLAMYDDALLLLLLRLLLVLVLEDKERTSAVCPNSDAESLKGVDAIVCARRT